MMGPTLPELERLEAAGQLEGKPALTAKLHAMRLEEEAAREFASVRTPPPPPVPQRREYPLPAEARGDCVGLICLNYSGQAFPSWRQSDGTSAQLSPASTLCFAPRAFIEFVREAWSRNPMLCQAFGRGVPTSGLRFVTFEPEDFEDENNLLEFLRSRLDGATPTEVGGVWRIIVGETTNAECLLNWYASAWRAGDQEQLKQLRSRLVRMAIPVPLLSDALLGKGRPRVRGGTGETSDGPEAA